MLSIFHFYQLCTILTGQVWLDTREIKSQNTSTPHPLPNRLTNRTSENSGYDPTQEGKPVTETFSSYKRTDPGSGGRNCSFDEGIERSGWTGDRSSETSLSDCME